MVSAIFSIETCSKVFFLPKIREKYASCFRKQNAHSGRHKIFGRPHKQQRKKSAE
jgi:hypothetical protein